MQFLKFVIGLPRIPLIPQGKNKIASSIIHSAMSGSFSLYKSLGHCQTTVNLELLR